MRYRKPKADQVYIGVDGEGQGRLIHRYIMLAAADSEGKRRWSVEDPNGLSTEQCLDFLLNLPKHAKYFSYSFNYDLTMMLKDLPDDLLYFLLRPELRYPEASLRKFAKPDFVPWKDFQLNLQGTKFWFERGKGKDRQKFLLWDIFKFFGKGFVGALKDWQVGEAEELDRMQKMKVQRSNFDKLSRDEIRKYCWSECTYMGQLARKLILAHDEMQIPLTSFYGAGSSATAVMKKHGTADLKKPMPDELRKIVASAFFGGRFENSVIGTVDGFVRNHDIRSAYPYQIYFLPCLEHGKWTHCRGEHSMRGARYGLVKYKLPASDKKLAWGPLPFRLANGSIAFPSTSGGGWVWISEYYAAKRVFPNVTCTEGWRYDVECDCHPFKWISHYYLERLRIGKDAAGLVIKLAINSVYGKLAQSVGKAPFNCWIWAGMITAGTRAQLLDLMRAHRDLANVLMVATDGLYTLEEVHLPSPLSTGTSHSPKPLGSWGTDEIPHGVFAARPGIYFPLDPTEEQLAEIRGRGIGKSAVFENWRLIMGVWERDGIGGKVKLEGLSRFGGAKSSISRTQDGKTYTRADRYGQWRPRPVETSFEPLPKRAGVDPDGRSLTVRVFSEDLESVPYKRALRGEEAIELQRLKEEALEQPDCDLTDYGECSDE